MKVRGTRVLHDLAGTSALSAAWQGSWSQRILWLALALLPFQQALTLEVGFPLKASEILAIVGIAASLAESRRGYFSHPASMLAGALTVLVVISSAWNWTNVSDSDTHPGYPLGGAVDTILYTGYAGLAICLFLTLVKSMDLNRALGSFAISIRLAALYCLVQTLAWHLGSSILTSVNGVTQLGRMLDSNVPRNGSFLEGNYLGFYAVACLFACLRLKDYVGVAVAAAVVFYSQSTTSMLALSAALVATVALRPTVRKIIVVGAGLASACIAVLSIAPLRSMAYKQLVKLGFLENTLGDSYGYSLRNRTANTDTGFAIAEDHPWLGVGQGQYGAYYREYLDLTGLPAHFGQQAVRPIANNVYAQIASEAGFIALAVFAALLIVLLWRARKDSSAMTGLVVATAVGSYAYPSWTTLILWAALSLPALATQKTHAAVAPPAVDPEVPQSPTRSPGRPSVK